MLPTMLSKLSRCTCDFRVQNCTVGNAPNMLGACSMGILRSQCQTNRRGCGQLAAEQLPPPACQHFGNVVAFLAVLEATVCRCLRSTCFRSSYPASLPSNSAWPSRLGVLAVASCWASLKFLRDYPARRRVCCFAGFPGGRSQQRMFGATAALLSGPSSRVG